MRPIHILLTEGYSDWEIAPLAGLGRAFFGADIRFASLDGQPLRSAAGLSVTDLETFAPDAGSVVVICGGPAFEGSRMPALQVPLQTAYEKDCVIAAICGGTLALADAGLLDAVRHTSNAPGYIKGFVPSYAGESFYADQSNALRDDRIITAPAPAIASFAAECLLASGVERTAVNTMLGMLAAEHKILDKAA